MKKILLILLSLLAYNTYGQKIDFALCDEFAQCKALENSQKYAIGNVAVYTNPIVEKQESAISFKAGTVKSNTSALKTCFHVSVEQSGNYYFLASVLSTYLNNRQFQKISVYVNNQYQGILGSTRADWEIIGLEHKPMIYLEKGDNLITFATDMPFYPEVDAIQITKDKSSLIAENLPYNNYKLRAQKYISSSNSETKESWEVKPQNIGIVDNNKVTAWKDVPVVYTYQRKITVSSTETMEIHTTPVDDDDYYSVDTYMYLYKIDDPYRYSWTNDNSTGYHSKITATLPKGDYYLVIRAKQSQYATQKTPRQGLVNVYCNGELLNEKVPVSGYLVDAPVKSKGAINFFTSKTSASVRLFLIDGDRMVFNSEPYTYYAPADYYWMEGARKKITFKKTDANWKVLVSATGGWWINYGKCDLYAGFEDAPSKYMSKFPNLKSGDAILMAGDNSSYNSAAWAGGITDRNIWIGNSSKGSPYVWKTWDDYFGNKPARYEKAPSYTRTGRGARSIVVYSKDSTMNGITHFAVMNRANNQLHGFDCESKIGTWGRITHTEQSLCGTEFGKPYYSYYEEGGETIKMQVHEPKNENLTKAYTFEQSVKDGLSVLEEVKLSSEEMKKLDGFCNPSLCKSFGKKYNEWMDGVLLGDDVNGRYERIFGQKYKNLLMEGKNNWKGCFNFLCGIIFSGDDESAMSKDFASVLLCDVMAPQYSSKMDSIKTEWQKNQYTDEGKYICPTVEYFTKKYVKSILKNIRISDDSPDESGSEVDDGLTFTGHNIVVNLSKDAVVSLHVQNCVSDNIIEVIAPFSMPKGTNTFNIDQFALSSGVYVCTLDVNGKKYNMKFRKK